MLRILVVDDEMPIRQGLAVIVADCGRQFEVVGEAANGCEALSMIEACKPDLVITDIKMPNMNGVELVKKLSVRYPDIKKVVLSGFDEFEFVREVMKEGVLDYLLKPIVEAQLQELLVKIDRDTEAEREKKRDSLLMDRKLSESLPLLREQVLQQLVRANTDRARREAAEKLRSYNAVVAEGPQFAVLVHLDNVRFLHESGEAEQAKIRQFIVKNVAQETAERHGACHSFYCESYLILLCTVPDLAGEEARIAVADEIYANLGRYARFRVTVVAGKIANRFEAVGDSYESAVDRMPHRFYRSGGVLLDAALPAPPFVSSYSPKVSSELQKGWLDGLATGDAGKIADALDAFCDYHRRQPTLPALVLLELANAFQSVQSDNVRFREALIDHCGGGFAYVKFLDRFDTLDAIRFHTAELLAEVGSRMRENDRKREKKAIQQVKEYINEHYREEITLGKMAELVYINANYLSELFKMQCSINFIDYVTQVRIDQAKKLLKTSPIKTYAVGERVGYEDPAYFSKVFKKLVGVSPSEYRNLIE